MNKQEGGTVVTCVPNMLKTVTTENKAVCLLSD